MIYLTEGNTPLNEAYNDEIVHLGNNTYQLTFRFPTSDTKWELLKEETFLTADDLHGEQDFYIFEVEKQQGYIQVYANQVISLLNNYIVSSIEVDRVSGTRVLSAFAGSITRANPFSFFSDIDDRHTLNIKDKNAMEVLAKGKHSILGQWGGDMVRNGYNLRLLKNGGSENESLFMYKKNLSSYQHKTSTKSLKTRITFKTTVKGEGENAVDHDYMVVIDSPLLGNYSQIYEDVVEVNDQDVTDEASLIEYGKQYFRTSMCDMLEDNLEISVVGQSDVAVQMFDVVSFYHEWYGLDVRKKITKYTYSPMAKLLKSIGFGTFQSSLANAIGGIVNDAVLNESRNLHQIFEERLKKEIANADRAFDAEFFKREKTITDAIELAKAKAEEVKQELSDTINQRFNSFDNGPLKEAKRKAEEALRNAGASSSLAQESKRIGLDSVARLEAFKVRKSMKVGGRNLWIKSKTVGAVIEKLPENHVTGQKECYRLENNSTLMFNIEPDFSSRLYQKVTFSAWVKYENVVQGRNFWNVFNCFKHYLFRKNSETGVQSGPDYATLGMYKGSADWKYITFTYDYSEKTNFDQLKTSLRFNLEGATSGTAWVTGIKVEIGSVATDWSPAPEDADGLITEAKATFERTAQGLRTDLSAIQEYVNKDGQRQEALQRYTREESTRQATAVRELVNRDFVGKATYQEDVKGINQRIEAVKTSANKDIASQIASYRQSVDGKFTDISSQITTYKQDVGGQISGLSNRLTSSEQGTTTQISNISNRINSNKQGTDNQISNLKTQVATNKDNAERQMGRISDQVSANKANADSQFANVTNQLVRKVETTDFQRVKETSKLYERILGNTENGIADKVARMALTNQLFQVEVGKYSVSGPNLIKNSDFKNATNEWGSTQNLGRLVKHSFYHNGQKDLMRLSNATKNENFLYSYRFNLERNTDYVLNFRGFNNSALASYDVYILGRRAGESDGFTIVKKVVSSKKLSTSRCEDVSVTFNSGEMDNAYIRFDNNGSSSGTADLYITEVDLYKGYKPRTWQPHPEDAVADANKKLEATQTKMTQLAGSWAVQNINSAGDIISGINLGANGHNRFVGKLTHITGETLIDRAVIKSAMVDKLKTGNFEAGSVTTTILDAEAVTAEKLKVDDALIKKLTATDAFIDQLISKRIFSIKVESVISSSTFLEAYQGRIGGFTLGQFDQGGGRWISGVNQFSVGMGNGAGHGVRTAFWANWGNNWNYAGPKAWNVNTDGKMYCRNEVGFYDQVDFSNSSRANFYGNTTFSRSPVFSNGIELGSKDVLGDGWNPKGGRNAVVWWNQVGSGSVKYWMEQKSDRRLKENITDTAVKALDKINRLRMVAFDFIENKKHEEIGLIAQEAETIVPKIVSRDPENPDGYLHIDYTALVPYLIKAIQELNQKIEKMEKTIA
ncbi:PblB-type protein, partial [Streptococcus phage 11865]